MNGSVDVTGLGYRYPSGKGIRGVTFSVQPGEVVCIFGRNGSGKSTLLTVLSTYLRPHRGSYRVCGLDAVMDRKRAREYIFPVFDENAHFGGATGRENLELFRALCASPDNPCISPEERSGLELEPDLDRAVEEYSLGMQRKLSLVQALWSGKPVLYFDEPTLGLDTPAREEFFTRIRRRASGGSAVIYGTNRVEETRHADRILSIQNGELREVRSPAEVTDGLIPVRIRLGEGERIEYLDRIEELPALIGGLLPFGYPRSIEVLGMEDPISGWTEEAEQKVARAPPLVRPMIRRLVERHARERGYSRINEQVVAEAQKRFEQR